MLDAVFRCNIFLLGSACQRHLAKRSPVQRSVSNQLLPHPPRAGGYNNKPFKLFGLALNVGRKTHTPFSLSVLLSAWIWTFHFQYVEEVPNIPSSLKTCFKPTLGSSSAVRIQSNTKAYSLRIYGPLFKSVLYNSNK